MFSSPFKRMNPALRPLGDRFCFSKIQKSTRRIIRYIFSLTPSTHFLGPAKVKLNTENKPSKMQDEHPIPVADIHGHLAHYPGEEEHHHHDHHHGCKKVMLSRDALSLAPHGISLTILRFLLMIGGFD
jgi:hypothetical protein